MNIFQTETIQFHGKRVQLDFVPGLNLLAGENGTFKTTMLEELLKQKDSKRVYGFSPKRNTVAQELKAAIQQIDTNQKTKESFQKQLQGNSKILPTGFVESPSFSELFGMQAKNLHDSFDSILTKKQAYGLSRQ